MLSPRKGAEEFSPRRKPWEDCRGSFASPGRGERGSSAPPGLGGCLASYSHSLRCGLYSRAAPRLFSFTSIRNCPTTKVRYLVGIKTGVCGGGAAELTPQFQAVRQG